MSFEKLDPIFPSKNQEISREDLINLVQYSLHKDFGNSPHTVKKIGSLTGANLRSVKNWYDGVKPPSPLHFFKLLSCSITLQKHVLIYLFGEQFWDDYKLISGVDVHNLRGDDGAKNDTIYSAKSDPINVPIKLNKRQKWFLLQLQTGHKRSADHIASQFNISLKTAKRDIADLKEKGKIRFHGSRKTGYYVLAVKS